MVDVRKRTGSKGTTYQVRLPSRSAASGFIYKTFATKKDARHYVEHELPKHRGNRHDTIRSVEQAVRKWLAICEFEGRDGKDPVSRATLDGYKHRAAIMLRYAWPKELYELEAADIRAFRSWLLEHHTRDIAKKVLSCFHSVMLEMVSLSVLPVDPAARVTIQQSRYKEPVQIPSVEEMQTILGTADSLANDKNYFIAKAWKRYRPMVYLAADSGMRPQEYLVLPIHDLLEKGVRISQALDRSNKIGPPKTRAGRRFIPLGQDTLEMVTAYVKKHDGPNSGKLVFPGDHGGHQQYRKFLRDGWHKLMDKAGMMEEVEVKGKKMLAPIYTPYSLRHFFASMMISQNKDLKTIQERMGHADAALTLNVYGHLVRLKQAEENPDSGGILSGVLAQSHPKDGAPSEA